MDDMERIDVGVCSFSTKGALVIVMSRGGVGGVVTTEQWAIKVSAVMESGLRSLARSYVWMYVTRPSSDKLC